MAPSRNPNKRFVILLVLASSALVYIFISFFRSQPAGTRAPAAGIPAHHVDVSSSTLTGPVIMPTLGNETLKAELGRASWKLFHTVFARFPDEPTPEERTALQAYIHLFQRLYPCGDCAEHFRLILEKYPPQVSSRSVAAAWGCHVHNEVNKDLGKDVFDCSTIGDFYDCGCADDEKSSTSTVVAAPVVAAAARKIPDLSEGAKEKIGGGGATRRVADGGDDPASADDAPLRLEMEGYGRGG